MATSATILSAHARILRWRHLRNNLKFKPFSLRQYINNTISSRDIVRSSPEFFVQMSTMTLELLTGLDKNFWFNGRLETFGQWPFKPDNGTCTAERMAAAGFFVVEGHDELDVGVECFICSKQLDGWEPNDDPWQEHAKHQKDCPYVLLQKQDEKQWTVDDLFTLMKAYYVKQCTRRKEEVVKTVKSESDTMAKKIPKIYKAERYSRKAAK